MSFPIPGWYFSLSMTLFGLLFGSFANVVIWRQPRGESIARPGSHCPGCDAPIAWYDNIPVVSWLVLRGRCRQCSEPISLRYPLVELASGILFALAAWRFGVTWQAVFAAAVFWLLLVLSLIDLDHMRLPNQLVVMLAAIALGVAFISQVLSRPIGPLVGVAMSGPLASPIVSALVGAVIAVAISGGTAAAYAAVRGRTGLGMGDVKLLGALGLVLGPYVLASLFFGSVFGLVFGLAKSRGTTLRGQRIPFGPFLAGGAILAALFGPALLRWYLRLAGVA